MTDNQKPLSQTTILRDAALKGARAKYVTDPLDHQTTPTSREWWDGHRTGFSKGLYEARLQAIDFAKEHPEAASALRLLAHTFHELSQQ